MKQKLYRRSKGQSIVEFTLLTPLMLAALYIPADFGIAFFTAHLVQNATREAARIGTAMNPFNQTTVENEATNRLPTGRFVVSSVSANLDGSSTSTYVHLYETSAGYSHWYIQSFLISADKSCSSGRKREHDDFNKPEHGDAF